MKGKFAASLSRLLLRNFRKWHFADSDADADQCLHLES
jgi:hypothetical protein